MATFKLKPLAISLGIAWGLCMLLLGWAAAFGWGDIFVEQLSNFYIGYSDSFLGGIIGGIWGFVIGGLFGLVWGYFYNYFSKKLSKRK